MKPNWNLSGPSKEKSAVKLNTKGRYAVMAMVDLAANSGATGQEPGARRRPVPLAEIAERQEISLSYLEQLFAKLRRGALVKSVRGPGGGYLLARGADETRISDIILAVDEPIRATRCMPGQPVGCRGNSSRCLTHDLWEELGNQIYLYLNSVSVADVVARRVLGTSGLFAPAVERRTRAGDRPSEYAVSGQAERSLELRANRAP